jgi:hypothetical protein
MYLQSSPSINTCTATLVSGVDPSKITDIDTFLMTTMNDLYVPAMRKDNFLTLYNDQYLRNLEVITGILFISAVLAKMMFYPIVI